MLNPQKSVVITGASSGIGRASVALMSQAGWRVFATVRKAADQQKLREANVVPIVMDVEDESSIKAAAAEISTRLDGRGLDGLVNCAGIGVVRPVEYASLSDIRHIYEINVFGQILVSQALLPLLRESRGRIVNITSVGVNIAIPFGGLLNSSKSAFAMMSDSMRLELRPFGVRVIAVEPGAISTPAVEKTLGDIENVIENLPPEARAQYGEMLRTFGRKAYTREKNGSSPRVVAEAVVHALSSNRPRIRYRVGKHAKLLATLPKLLPESVLDALRIRMFGLEAPASARPQRKTPQAGSPLRPVAVNPK
ncbi:MAG TPA: SDR family NAD(P)-dependent oxidoreductase [Terriglobales bacterium]|nr:SDR family NAD(P)-dependent oxidoreductase [Terriglobales bacterium]